MKQQNILAFWRDVEVFNLPDFNKECYLAKQDVSFPWQNERPLRNPKTNIWRYTLFFGRIRKRDIIDTIDGLLEKVDIPMDWEEPVNGDSCFSALLLDQYGRPDKKSYVPAAFIFGISCLEEKAPISEVTKKLSVAQTEFELRYNIPEQVEGQTETTGPPVTWQLLHEEVKYLTGITSTWNKTSVEVYIIAKEVPKDAEPDTSFLNSFYLDDLNLLLSHREKDFGMAFRHYISLAVSEQEREDLIAKRDYLYQSINPKLMPMGRWPANVSHGLYAAQLGAVSTTLDELKNSNGIKGINGPPGTGKTTLLLDIIAEIVVTRAIKLIEVGHDKLFAGFNRIEKEGGFSGYFDFKSTFLHDNGIVVASNNNAAVENITKTLPSIGKIDKDTFKDADYFSVCSQRLIENESWGILSAALGNAQNKSAFKWKFWMTDSEKGIPGFQDILWEVYKIPQNDQTHIYRQKFDEVKVELETLVKDFGSFKKQAANYHNQYPTFLERITAKNKIEGDLHCIQATITSLIKDENSLKLEIKETGDLIRLSENILAHVKQQKPSFFFFHKLFNTKTYKKWRVDYDYHLAQLREQTDKTMLLSRQLGDNSSKLNRSKVTEADLNKTLITVIKDIENYFELKEELFERYGISFPDFADGDFYSSSSNEIHLSTPYSSEKINTLRSNIFLKSLELHRYCILSNAKQIRNNLNLFFEMIEGRSLVSPSVCPTLWGTLFLCVPVISTTLASVSRLFSSMGKESIGWLLLDEAGQATPQSAAGAIWRSKRCIIVGDPLQIEPVVTIPSKLIFKLRQQEGIDQIWSPSSSSVQILADRVSKKGTYMASGGESDEKIWTGFPLRTHRRCENPMFDIANKIAYSGQMVKATKDVVEDGYIGESAWFHIVANSTPINKHVLTDELDILRDKIEALKAAGYAKDIFVISPFKSVAKACESEFRQVAKVSCGTIHRFQGREADVVFLVLGGNPATQGARDWASKKPNMLNVALTRARKRFYVIGNQNLWGKCSFFDLMAARLPRVNSSTIA